MAVNLESVLYLLYYNTKCNPHPPPRSIQPYNTYIYIFGDDADHCTGRHAIFKSHSVTVTMKENIILFLRKPRRRIGKWR